MVDIKTDWNEQNLKEYVKYTIFLRNKASKIALISFAVCGALILAMCIAVFFVFSYAYALIFALIIVLLAVSYAVFFALNIKSCTSRILKANAESELNRVMISEDDIICFDGDEPVGTISWSKMADIHFSEKAQAAYLTTKGNAVLILECKNILSGTADELKEVIGKKRNELPKEA